MTRREKLQEQYEDALFALLMDDLAIAEGKSAEEENEQLKNDPRYAVPPEVRQRCLRTISRHCTKKTIHRAGRLFYRGFTKVAVIGMICSIFISTAFALSPSFRVKMLNFAIEVFNDNTQFSFIDESVEKDTSTNPYNIIANWLPEGYSLENEVNSNFRSAKYYCTEAGDEISISVFKSENNVLGIDTENSEVESVTIQNCSGLLSLKDGVAQLVWGNEEECYKVYIEMNSIENSKVQELMTIAQNLIIEKN